MIQADGELIKTYEMFLSNQIESDRLDQTIQRRYNLRPSNASATATTLLMVATDEQFTPSRKSLPLMSAAISNSLSGADGEPKDVPDLKLIRTWITWPDSHVFDKLQKLFYLSNVSDKLDLREALLALAVQVLQMDTARVLEDLRAGFSETNYAPDTSAEQRKLSEYEQVIRMWGSHLPCALEKVVQYGGDGQLHLVKSVLEQMPEMPRSPNDYPLQLKRVHVQVKKIHDEKVAHVRTYALAVLVQLSGQPLSQYGLERAVALDPDKGSFEVKEPIKDPVELDNQIAKWRKWYRSQPQAKEGEN